MGISSGCHAVLKNCLSIRIVAGIHSHCSPTVLEMVRYTAGSRTAVNENGAVDRAVTDHGDLTVKLTADALRLQKNCVRTKKEFWYRKRVP